MQDILSDGAPSGPGGPPPSAWETWPFGGTGDVSWLFMFTKALFLLAILAGAVYLVRRLFGPGGWLAEPWMRESWQAKLAQEIEELDRKRAAGELTDEAYERKKAKLTRKLNP